MRASRNSRLKSTDFVSVKAATAIPVGNELLREALIQATLDPAIRGIDFIPTAASSGGVIALNTIVLRGDPGDRILDIVETRPLRSIDDEGSALLAVDHLGLPALTITAADIRREPRSANSSLVWGCRHRRVWISDRVRALEALADEGPMQLARLSAELRWSADPVASVLAMACIDLVELDLTSAPLGPTTIVRRRIAEGESR
jgi:hypothetical protein